MWDCFLACASDFTSTLIHQYRNAGISTNRTNWEFGLKIQFFAC